MTNCILTVIVWIDAGSTLLTNSLKFLHGKAYLLPHVQHRRGNIVTELNSTISDATTGIHHDDVWAQIARFLPFQYSSSLPEGIAAEPDPFYSVLDLFEFAASSERQYLNMLSSQIKAQVQAASTSVKSAITVLQTIAISLQEHTERLKQNIMTIKDRGGPQWPRTEGESMVVIDPAVESTLRDYQALLDDAVALSGHCQVAMSIVMSLANLEESRIAIQQHNSISKLTHLALIFVPLSFVTSFFGMNMSEFGGSIEPRFWVIFAVFLTLITVFTVFMFWSPQDVRRWFHEKLQNSELYNKRPVRYFLQRLEQGQAGNQVVQPAVRSANHRV